MSSVHTVYGVVFRIVLNMREQSLEFNGMSGISTTRAVAEDTSLLPSTAPGPVLHIAHRQHAEGIFLDELTVGEDDQVPVMMQNPAYIEEVELDEDKVDPADITPLVSGDTPIVTVPASDNENIVEDLGEDGDEDDDMQDFLEKMEKLDTEVKDLRKEMWISCPPSRRTLAPSSLLLSHKLRFGTQRRLGSKNTDCTLIQV